MLYTHAASLSGPANHNGQDPVSCLSVQTRLTAAGAAAAPRRQIRWHRHAGEGIWNASEIKVGKRIHGCDVHHTGYWLPLPKKSGDTPARRNHWWSSMLPSWENGFLFARQMQPHNPNLSGAHGFPFYFYYISIAFYVSILFEPIIQIAWFIWSDLVLCG